MGISRRMLVNLGIDLDTVELFISYHESNPAIYREFEKFALKCVERGKKTGAKLIMERVRWEVEIEKGGDFKVNNNFTSYYARVFMLLHPSLDLFETREIKGLKT